MAYLERWIDAAKVLFSQALAGEPELVEGPPDALGRSFGFTAHFGGDSVGGDWDGDFLILLDRDLLETPLLGEGVDQRQAWGELLREVAEAAAGDLFARTGSKCRLESFHGLPDDRKEEGCHAFQLKSSTHAWAVQVRDGLRPAPNQAAESSPARPDPPADGALDLLLDVELEATLRFGCRELLLGEVLDLGPGDIVQLDRTVRDPVDLVVGDKIVARGEVVLVNGNFGLRVTEVATPRRRLESIRCLF